MIKFLKNIALLEFIPTKQITGYLAELIGLDKENNLLGDMGIMMIIGVGIVLLLIVLLVVGYFAMNYSYEFYRRYR